MPGVKKRKKPQNKRMKNKFDSKSPIILGMQDAIVSLLGLIAGLYFAFTDPNIIVISCIISSITAALSMGAANYQAVKSTASNSALKSGLYTGVAYLATCGLLILPFLVCGHRTVAILSVFTIAVSIIYLFNWAFYREKSFRQHFVQMLSICSIVTIAAFLIGEIATRVFGI